MWQESRIGSEALRLPREKVSWQRKTRNFFPIRLTYGMGRKRLKYANMREAVCANNG